MTMDTIAYYLDQYRDRSASLPGGQIHWVNRHREENLGRFREVGFPSQRDEDWRYTSIRPITGKQFSDENLAPDQIDYNAFSIEKLDSYRIVFVNGVCHTAPDSERCCEGLRIASLASVLKMRPESIESHFGAAIHANRHGFTALNNAFSADGAVIELKSRCRVDKPIELLFIQSGGKSLSQPRNFIIAGSGSHAEIIERHVSSEAGYALTNSTTEVVLSGQAEIDYYLIQTPSQDAYHVCGIWAKQAEASRFSCRTVTLGGALIRNDLRTEMTAVGAHCDMWGLYSLSGRQHVDNHTTMIHGAENCTSNELYKGVLDGSSRGVFHGRIKVEKGAQKTDARQANNTLLLSRDAEIDTKPQLEIYADDVKCSHGATVGQIDEVSLFYLRSRGIDEADARSLLTFAFVNDVLNEVAIAPVKDALTAILSGQLIDRQE